MGSPRASQVNGISTAAMEAFRDEVQKDASLAGDSLGRAIPLMIEFRTD